MQEKSPTKTKPKPKQLPGYRFLFRLLGICLLGFGLWDLYQMATSPAEGVWPISHVAVMAVLRPAVGLIYLYYARILAEPGLTPRHWWLGVVVMVLGILSVWGVLILFLLLIWTDDDTRSVFYAPGSGEKRKLPLPGYRFLFTAYGLFLMCASVVLTVAIWTEDDLKKIPAVMLLLSWLGSSALFIGYAIRLRQPGLEERHWRLGHAVIAAGIITGFGWPFAFMWLIWGDEDTRAVFSGRAGMTPDE